MDISRRQAYVYIGLAAVVAALGARYLLASHTPAAPEGQPMAALVSSPSPVSSPVPTLSTAPLVVYVCGAVAQPGVYRLPPGARVADLLEQAGGAKPKAELQAINLAAKLVDGQQIVVPERGAAPLVASQGGSAAGAASSSGGSVGPVTGAPGVPVNLNTASLEELDALPGVGPSTAQKIVDYRTANGGFKSVDDLKNVSGIGDVRFAALKDLVTV
jgi:competence protein ComEA